jgi:hypothetical protein
MILLPGAKNAGSATDPNSVTARRVERTSEWSVEREIEPNQVIKMSERYRPPLAATVLEPSKMPKEETPKKIRGRPFPPGNPGRPLGSKNRTTRLVEQLVDGEAEKVTRKFIALALAGDVRCIQMYPDRVLPKRNGRPVDFSLPAINDVRDVVTATAAIATGVNDGNLTAEEAGQLMHFLDGFAKILATHDLVTRLEALESQRKKTP